MEGSFKKSKSINERIDESTGAMTKYPDRVPVIVEKTKESNAPLLKRFKFLVDKDATLGKFMHEIRCRMNIAPEHALFFHINGKMCPSTFGMGYIYSINRDADGFLYVTYSLENVFGNMTMGLVLNS